MIYVYYTRFDKRLSEESFAAYLKNLPAQFSEQIHRYRFWEDAHASLFGKLLLKEALREVSGNNFTLDDVQTDTHKKLYINGDVHFNISHSGNYCICAITQGMRLGADIEKIRDIKYMEFDRVFSAEELAAIDAHSEPLSKFYELWTQKESIIKADGRGMTISLKSITIEGNIALLEHKENWYLHKIDLNHEYACHIATEKPVEEKIVLKKIDF